MRDFFSDMFASDFMPHGHCYFWAPEILWSHAISNTIIAMAYFAIPVTLVYIFRKRDDFKFIWMMILFAIFILGCGITHVMDVIVIWEPYYRLDALFRIITAIASIGTAIVLVKVTPGILKIPTANEWKKVNLQLEEKQVELEEMIEALHEKQKELEKANELLNINKEELQVINEELTASQEELITSNEILIENKLELEKVNQELKLTEKNMMHLNNELEERVKIRTLELEQRNDELVKINIDLDNFIYTASHDLKAPLANLEGLMSLLKLQVRESTDEKTLKLIGMTEQAVSKMNETIGGLGEIIKAQKDKGGTLEKINFIEILENVKYDLSESILESRAVIDEDIKIEEFVFRKNNLRSILQNLLTNAIKYRSPERELHIKISTYYEGNNFIVSVQDNGLGIPEKHQSKLFTMFRRFHTHVAGTGIGLYIIKRIVENSNGKVVVESEVNKGSTFKILIPLK